MVSFEELKNAKNKRCVKVTLNNKNVFIGEITECRKLEEDDEYSITIAPDGEMFQIEAKQSEIKSIDILDDDACDRKYRYVSVHYEDDGKGAKTYYYIDDGLDVKLGNIVVVDRVGEQVKGKAVKIYEYDIFNAPYPVEKTKKILKIFDKNLEMKKIYGDNSTYIDLEDSLYKKYENKPSLVSNLDSNILPNGRLSKKFNIYEYKPYYDELFASIEELELYREKASSKFIKFFKRIIVKLNQSNVELIGDLIDKFFYENKYFPIAEHIDEIIDELDDYLIEDIIDIGDVYNLTIYLLVMTKNTESVSLGIGLITIFSEEVTNDLLDIIGKCALCEELVMISNFAIEHLENSNDIRFKLAKKAEDVSKMVLVGYIEPENEEIKKWLIVNGTEGVSRYPIPAIPIAEKIDLLEVLKSEDMSFDLIDGISDILKGLLDPDENPAPGLKNKKEIFNAYFSLNNRFYDSIKYNLGLVHIFKYLLKEDTYEDLREKIHKYFLSERVLRFIFNILNNKYKCEDEYFQKMANICEILIVSDNNIFNKIIYKKLKENNNVMFRSAIELLLKDDEYHKKALEMIYCSDFSEYYGEPAREIIEEERLEVLSELLIMQNKYNLIIDKLVVDGLKCRYIPQRNLALSVIENWMFKENKRFKDLPESIQVVLEELEETEIFTNFKRRINIITDNTNEEVENIEDENVIFIHEKDRFDIFEADLNLLFNPYIIREGQKYVDLNMVNSSLQVGDECIVYVQGLSFNEEYKVKFKRNGSKITKMSCTCDDQDNCVHEYAAIKHIRDKYSAN